MAEDLDIPTSPALAGASPEFTRLMLSYRFAVSEIMTKLGILQEEFTAIHDYNPIEHVVSRIKSPESIVAKARRKAVPLTAESLREHIADIAGVRVTCSFLSDTYRVAGMLTRQGDIRTVRVKDYIEAPKPNGYKSLHLLVQVPVFFSDRVDHVPVEIQVRTIAMDFWASLEHKIFYKYDGAVPAGLAYELREAAEVANRLDARMEGLHNEVARSAHALEDSNSSPHDHAVRDTGAPVPLQAMR